MAAPASPLMGRPAQASLVVLGGPCPISCAPLRWGRPLRAQPPPGAGLKAAPQPAASTAWERSPLLSCRVFGEGRDAAPGAAGWVQQEVGLAELGV